VVEASESAVRKSLPYIDRDARLYVLDVERQIAWYLQNGMLQKPLSVQQFVDTSFVNEAVRQLGP
jgi:ABC-type nitrate/sulfonate/bicarbonate transport system substrate-binding protein